MVADHLAKASFDDQSYGVGAVLGGQHAVEGGRRPAPLQVAEDGDAGLAVQTTFNFAGHDMADTAEFGLGPLLLFAHHADFRQFRTLSHHDQGEPLALTLAIENLVADVFVSPRDLGNENHVTAAADAGVQGDPPGVATHHFQHHDSLVAGRGGV